MHPDAHRLFDISGPVVIRDDGPVVALVLLVVMTVFALVALVASRRGGS